MNTLRYALNYGIGTALVGILGLYFQQFIEPESWMSSLLSIIVSLAMVFIIYTGVLNYFKTSGAPMTFGAIFKTALIITLIGAFVFGAYTFVYYEYLAPGAKEKYIALAMERMEAQGIEQAENAIEMMRSAFGVMAFAGSVINVVFVGLVTGIIVGLWKKEN